MTADHGFTNPSSPEGVRLADAPCLEAIEECMGFVCAFADLAREHARLNDLAGLEHDMKRARAHFVFAAQKLREMQERHEAARSAAQTAEAALAEEFA